MNPPTRSASYKKIHLWSFFVLFITLGFIFWIYSFEIAPVMSGDLVL